MSDILLEICCGSADDVLAAKAAGADRVELNSSMFLGGITPSIGEVKVALQTGLPIMAMVRPRSGGFCYTEAEFQTMLYDVDALLEAGADGIVFGILQEDGQIDLERSRIMRERIGQHTAVFHRAFDVVPDWKASMDQLVEIGIDRILTSGQCPSVRDGSKTVAEMIAYADGRLEILPGAGITLQNVQDVLRETGSKQIHIALNQVRQDSSTQNNQSIFFGGALYPPENLFEVADREKIHSLRQIIDA
ncbi:MAG: copper homeostasis protein CutC [Eubacteriales bacterium]|nr:copper homeostasis protein CutC [Eubacteriales bacterium]